MLRVNPSMDTDALDEVARRDPSAILVQAIIHLRREIAILCKALAGERESLRHPSPGGWIADQIRARGEAKGEAA